MNDKQNPSYGYGIWEFDGVKYSVTYEQPKNLADELEKEQAAWDLAQSAIKKAMRK